MALSEKARQLRNQYQKEFRQNNPDKIRQYNVTYWEKRAGTHRTISYEEIFNLREKGFSQRHIAEELNISLGTVNKILNSR